jgi:hypothetical protein
MKARVRTPATRALSVPHLRTAAQYRHLRTPSRPVRNCGMTRILLASLAVSLAARAADTRLDAVRIEPTAAAAATASDAPVAAPDSRSAAPYEAQQSSGSHWPVHFGATAGMSLPRPLAAYVYARAFGFVALGFSYSDFPAFIANPLLSIAGLKNGQTTVNLDQFSAYEGDLRIFPFFGDFFVGAGLGRQTFKASMTQSTTLGNFNGSVAVSTTYAAPRIGYLWTFGPGLTVGMDAGVQLKLSSDAQINLPSGSPADMQSQAQRVVDVFGNGPLPSFHLQLGWQY